MRLSRSSENGATPARKSTLARLSWATGVFSVGLIAIFSFQNCTQPPDTSGLSEMQSAAQGLDFAYDAVVDQVTYMSCSNFPSGSFDTSAYFTYRVGAYRQGGVGLTSTFLNDSQIVNSNAVRRVGLIEASTTNTNTVLQVAIRPINLYQSILATNAGSPVANEDYSNIFTPLGVAGITESLVGLPSGGRLHYYNDGTSVYGSRVEGDLSFASSVSLLQNIQQATTNTAYLSVTYTHATGASGSEETLALSPGDITVTATPGPTPVATPDPNRTVFGRGFKMQYGQPAVSGLYASFPTVVLQGMTEYSLQNTADRSGVSTWTCPTTMQFRIVRREDLGATGVNCVMKPDPPTLPNDLAMVRNQLRAEDWYVDMADQCIIPKKSSAGCYGDQPTVVYTTGAACDPQNLTTPQIQCVAYASVCYRNN